MTRAPLRFAAAFLILSVLPALADVVVPRDAQIIILGEVHDNPFHHAEQARLVADLRPKAMVWEMLSAEQLTQSQGVDRGNAAAFGAALGWEEAGWPAFAMYHPIFAASEGAVHFGGSVPRDLLMRAMKQGALSAWEGRTDWFDPSLALGPLAPEDQSAREDEQAEAHCGALPPHLLPGMVEAQRFRDAFMASVALKAVQDGLTPVVVITGTGHARMDVGIPAMIRAARPEIKVWSLGQLEGEPRADAPYDAVTVTAPTPRGDPCAAFQ